MGKIEASISPLLRPEELLRELSRPNEPVVVQAALDLLASNIPQLAVVRQTEDEKYIELDTIPIIFR